MSNKKILGGQTKSNPNQSRDPNKNPQHDQKNPQKPYGQNNQKA